MSLFINSLLYGTFFLPLFVMRKSLLAIVLLLNALQSYAQVPFFKSETGLKSDVYAYTSMQKNSAYSKLDSYSTVQFRVGNSIFLGADLATGLNNSYMGFVIRYLKPVSQYFNFGLQITPSFILNSRFTLAYTNANIYMNGVITSDHKLFWLSNTYWFSNNFWNSTIQQYTYIGYNFDLPYNFVATPLIGESHSWLMNGKMDLNLGLQLSYKQYTLGVWAREFIHKQSMIRIGLSAEF